MSRRLSRTEENVLKWARSHAEAGEQFKAFGPIEIGAALELERREFVTLEQHEFNEYRHGSVVVVPRGADR